MNITRIINFARESHGGHFTVKSWRVRSPWWKLIVRVSGVLGRTAFVGDWRFNNPCGIHLQFKALSNPSSDFSHPDDRLSSSFVSHGFKPFPILVDLGKKSKNNKPILKSLMGSQVTPKDFSPYCRVETSVAGIQISISNIKLNEESIRRFHGVPFLRQTACRLINSLLVNGLCLLSFNGGDLHLSSHYRFQISVFSFFIEPFLFFFFSLFLPSTFPPKKC